MAARRAGAREERGGYRRPGEDPTAKARLTESLTPGRMGGNDEPGYTAEPCEYCS